MSKYKPLQAEWAEVFGINTKQIYNRLYKGLSVKELFESN